MSITTSQPAICNNTRITRKKSELCPNTPTGIMPKYLPPGWSHGALPPPPGPHPTQWVLGGHSGAVAALMVPADVHCRLIIILTAG